jgi:hypothetical protein
LEPSRQPLRDQYIADIPTVDRQNPAAATEIAVIRPLRSRLTRAGHQRQFNLLRRAEELAQAIGRLSPKVELCVT